jgi:hypothetical protein
MSYEVTTDAQLLKGFFDCSLAPEVFDHRAHVRVAWLLLRQYELEEAVVLMCNGIAAFAKHAGASAKYNRTMTEALVRLMAGNGGGQRGLGWTDFCETNKKLLHDVRGLLGCHYSPERLQSDEAKVRFVDPDRAPLP